MVRVSMLVVTLLLVLFAPPASASTPTAATPVASPTPFPSVLSFVREDAAFDCDHIGWNIDNIAQVDARSNYYGVCFDGVGHYAFCARIVYDPALGDLGPPSSDIDWVMCAIMIANEGSSAYLSNPLYYRLFDGGGHEHPFTLDPFEGYPDSLMGSEMIAPFSLGGGIIAFEVPKATAPLFLVVTPDPLDHNERGVIVLSPLIVSNDFL